MPRGRLRLVRDEHRRTQHARLHQGDHGRVGADCDLSAAAYAGGEGSRPGHDEFLRAIRLDRTLSADEIAGAGERVETVAGRARKARRALRVHSLRLLLDLMPELLVEFGALSRTRRAAPVLPLARRQP